jgi:hypothetical protein
VVMMMVVMVTTVRMLMTSHPPQVSWRQARKTLAWVRLACSTSQAKAQSRRTACRGCRRLIRVLS